jgi:hypothetical protein
MARGPSLRTLRPARFRRGRSRASVEGLTVRIAALVAERQELRVSGAAEAAIERNRLQIARAQWELAHALIERHLPAVETAA